MRTYQIFKMIDNYKCEDYLRTSGHQYVTKNNSNKTVTKQPQISHRDRLFLG